LMVNGILFKNHNGFRYNNSIPGFVIGQIAPAVRPDHVAAVGLKIEHFEALETGKLQKSNAQIYSPDGLIKTLRRYNGSLSNSDLKQKLDELTWVVVRENPVDAASIILETFLLLTSPTKVSQSVADGLHISTRPFKEGFVENYVNPFVYDKVSRQLPIEESLSQGYLTQSWVVLWLALVVCLLSPMLIFLVARDGRPAVIIVSTASLAYALSLSIFSADIIPRYFVPLIPLAIVLMSAALGAFSASSQSEEMRTQIRGAP